LKRKTLDINGRTLSYLDNEKDGQALVCLHGHFGCGAMFSFLNDIFSGRLILPDQRGHGYSGWCGEYATSGYVDDADRLLRHENVTRPIVLGHSLGGVNAYHYTARHKDVKALIVEDIGTEIELSNDFILEFPREFGTMWDAHKAFEKAGLEFDPYFLESVRHDGRVWKFQFDYEGMAKSQRGMNGAYWDVWESIECPILLLHGKNSWACTTDNILEMGRRNRNVKTIIYEDAGHTLHDEYRERFTADVIGFIRETENI